MPNVSSFGAQTDNAVVSGTVTDRQMIIPEVPPQGLMSVGPRVTPNFVKEPWSKLNSYNFFDVVKDSADASYIAIKPVVPTNTELTDEEFWFKWSDPDAQLNELQEIVKTYNARIAQNSSAITAEVARATAAEATKAPVNHASEETVYGVGNAVNYGHVKLSYNNELNADANTGIALTPNVLGSYVGHDPIKYGADSSGASDSSDAIQTAIDECVKDHSNIVTFTPGIYLINKQLITPYNDDERVGFELNGSTLVANLEDSLFAIGYKTTDPDITRGSNCGSNSFIRNGTIKGVTRGSIKINTHYMNFRVSNMLIIGTDPKITVAESENFPSDFTLENCFIWANGSSPAQNLCEFNGTDNTITNCRLYNANVMVKDNSTGGSVFTGIHFLGISSDNQIAIETSGVTHVTNCYFDAVTIGVKCVSEGAAYTHNLSNNIFFTYKNNQNITMFDVGTGANNQHSAKITNNALWHSNEGNISVLNPPQSSGHFNNFIISNNTTQRNDALFGGIGFGTSLWGNPIGKWFNAASIYTINNQNIALTVTTNKSVFVAKFISSSDSQIYTKSLIKGDDAPEFGIEFKKLTKDVCKIDVYVKTNEGNGVSIDLLGKCINAFLAGREIAESASETDAPTTNVVVQ